MTTDVDGEVHDLVLGTSGKPLKHAELVWSHRGKEATKLDVDYLVSFLDSIAEQPCDRRLCVVNISEINGRVRDRRDVKKKLLSIISQNDDLSWTFDSVG